MVLLVCKPVWTLFECRTQVAEEALAREAEAQQQAAELQAQLQAIAAQASVLMI